MAKRKTRRGTFRVALSNVATDALREAWRSSFDPSSKTMQKFVYTAYQQFLDWEIKPSTEPHGLEIDFGQVEETQPKLGKKDPTAPPWGSGGEGGGSAQTSAPVYTIRPTSAQRYIEYHKSNDKRLDISFRVPLLGKAFPYSVRSPVASDMFPWTHDFSNIGSIPPGGTEQSGIAGQLLTGYKEAFERFRQEHPENPILAIPRNEHEIISDIMQALQGGSLTGLSPEDASDLMTRLAARGISGQPDKNQVRATLRGLRKDYPEHPVFSVPSEKNAYYLFRSGVSLVWSYSVPPEAIRQARAYTSHLDPLRNKLVEQELPNIPAWVASYTGKGVPAGDLLQEARMALIEAASTWDPGTDKKGNMNPYSFAPYAGTKIKHALSRMVRSARSEGGVVSLDALASGSDFDDENYMLEEEAQVGRAFDIADPAQSLDRILHGGRVRVYGPADRLAGIRPGDKLPPALTGPHTAFYGAPYIEMPGEVIDPNLMPGYGAIARAQTFADRYSLGDLAADIDAGSLVEQAIKAKSLRPAMSYEQILKREHFNRILGYADYIPPELREGTFEAAYIAREGINEVPSESSAKINEAFKIMRRVYNRGLPGAVGTAFENMITKAPDLAAQGEKARAAGLVAYASYMFAGMHAGPSGPAVDDLSTDEDIAIDDEMMRMRRELAEKGTPYRFLSRVRYWGPGSDKPITFTIPMLAMTEQGSVPGQRKQKIHRILGIPEDTSREVSDQEYHRYIETLSERYYTMTGAHGEPLSDWKVRNLLADIAPGIRESNRYKPYIANDPAIAESAIIQELGRTRMNILKLYPSLHRYMKPDEAWQGFVNVRAGELLASGQARRYDKALERAREEAKFHRERIDAMEDYGDIPEEQLAAVQELIEASKPYIPPPREPGVAARLAVQFLKYASEFDAFSMTAYGKQNDPLWIRSNPTVPLDVLGASLESIEIPGNIAARLGLAVAQYEDFPEGEALASAFGIFKRGAGLFRKFRGGEQQLPIHVTKNPLRLNELAGMAASALRYGYKYLKDAIVEQGRLYAVHPAIAKTIRRGSSEPPPGLPFKIGSTSSEEPPPLSEFPIPGAQLLDAPPELRPEDLVRGVEPTVEGYMKAVKAAAAAYHKEMSEARRALSDDLSSPGVSRDEAYDLYNKRRRQSLRSEIEKISALNELIAPQAGIPQSVIDESSRFFVDARTALDEYLQKSREYVELAHAAKDPGEADRYWRAQDKLAQQYHETWNKNWQDFFTHLAAQSILVQPPATAGAAATSPAASAPPVSAQQLPLPLQQAGTGQAPAAQAGATAKKPRKSRKKAQAASQATTQASPAPDPSASSTLMDATPAYSPVPGPNAAPLSAQPPATSAAQAASAVSASQASSATSATQASSAAGAAQVPPTLPPAPPASMPPAAPPATPPSSAGGSAGSSTPVAPSVQQLIQQSPDTAIFAGRGWEITGVVGLDRLRLTALSEPLIAEGAHIQSVTPAKIGYQSAQGVHQVGSIITIGNITGKVIATEERTITGMQNGLPTSRTVSVPIVASLTSYGVYAVPESGKPEVINDPMDAKGWAANPHVQQAQASGILPPSLVGGAPGKVMLGGTVYHAFPGKQPGTLDLRKTLGGGPLVVPESMVLPYQESMHSVDLLYGLPYTPPVAGPGETAWKDLARTNFPHRQGAPWKWKVGPNEQWGYINTSILTVEQTMQEREQLLGEMTAGEAMLEQQITAVAGKRPRNLISRILTGESYNQSVKGLKELADNLDVVNKRFGELSATIKTEVDLLRDRRKTLIDTIRSAESDIKRFTDQPGQEPLVGRAQAERARAEAELGEVDTTLQQYLEQSNRIGVTQKRLARLRRQISTLPLDQGGPVQRALSTIASQPGLALFGISLAQWYAISPQVRMMAAFSRAEESALGAYAMAGVPVTPSTSNILGMQSSIANWQMGVGEGLTATYAGILGGGGDPYRLGRTASPFVAGISTGIMTGVAGSALRLGASTVFPAAAAATLLMTGYSASRVAESDPSASPLMRSVLRIFDPSHYVTDMRMTLREFGRISDDIEARSARGSSLLRSAWEATLNYEMSDEYRRYIRGEYIPPSAASGPAGKAGVPSYTEQIRQVIGDRTLGHITGEGTEGDINIRRRFAEMTGFDVTSPEIERKFWPVYQQMALRGPGIVEMAQRVLEAYGYSRSDKMYGENLADIATLSQGDLLSLASAYEFGADVLGSLAISPTDPRYARLMDRLSRMSGFQRRNLRLGLGYAQNIAYTRGIGAGAPNYDQFVMNLAGQQTSMVAGISQAAPYISQYLGALGLTPNQPAFQRQFDTLSSLSLGNLMALANNAPLAMGIAGNLGYVPGTAASTSYIAAMSALPRTQLLTGSFVSNLVQNANIPFGRMGEVYRMLMGAAGQMDSGTLMKLMNVSFGMTPEAYTLRGGGLYEFVGGRAYQAGTLAMRGLEDWYMGQQRAYQRNEWQIDITRLGRTQQITRQQWALQDQSLTLSRQYEDWQFGMASTENAIQRQIFEARIGSDRRIRQINRGIDLQQRQWWMEDMNYQGTVAGLQYTWNMEDLQEALRYSTGRERRAIRRQMERAQIMYGLEETQRQTVIGRQQIVWGAQDQVFQIEEEQTNKVIELQRRLYDLQDERLRQQMEFTNQMRQVEDQMRETERKAQMEREEWQLEDIQRQKQYYEEIVWPYQDKTKERQRQIEDAWASYQNLVIASLAPSGPFQKAWEDAIDDMIDYLKDGINGIRNIAPLPPSGAQGRRMGGAME